MARSLRKGDTIKCSDAEEAAYLIHELAMEDIETDFLYEKDGEKGIWLVVTKVRTWRK